MESLIKLVSLYKKVKKIREIDDEIFTDIDNHDMYKMTLTIGMH